MPTYFKRLHHVGVVVQNLETSVAWHARCFGFKRLSDYSLPGARIAFIGRGELQLELFETDGSTPMAVEREEPSTNLRIGGVNHFAIMVDDLEQAIEDLMSQGVEIASPPATVPDGRGGRFAFIRDNERMLVELFQHAT